MVTTSVGEEMGGWIYRYAPGFKIIGSCFSHLRLSAVVIYFLTRGKSNQISRMLRLNACHKINLRVIPLYFPVIEVKASIEASHVTDTEAKQPL